MSGALSFGWVWGGGVYTEGEDEDEVDYQWFSEDGRLRSWHMRQGRIATDTHTGRCWHWRDISLCVYSIHNLGLVGHIEDISVAKDQQGKRLGLRIIQALDYIAKEVGCYKVCCILSEPIGSDRAPVMLHRPRCVAGQG